MLEINQPLESVKPDFLEFISIIKGYRLNELNKKGLIFVPEKEINLGKLNRYIYGLYENGILDNFSETNLRHLECFGHKINKKDLGKSYIKIKKGNKKYIALSCGTVEKIEEYVRTLYVPGSSGLIIRDNGKYACRQGNNNPCTFSDDSKIVLNFLYKHINNPQGIDATMRECNLTKKRLSSACYNIRNKLKSKLGYTKKEVEKILPKYNNGYYVLII